MPTPGLDCDLVAMLFRNDASFLPASWELGWYSSSASYVTLFEPVDFESFDTDNLNLLERGWGIDDPLPTLNTSDSIMPLTSIEEAHVFPSLQPDFISPAHSSTSQPSSFLWLFSMPTPPPDAILSMPVDTQLRSMSMYGDLADDTALPAESISPRVPSSHEPRTPSTTESSPCRVPQRRRTKDNELRQYDSSIHLTCKGHADSLVEEKSAK